MALVRKPIGMEAPLMCDQSPRIAAIRRGLIKPGRRSDTVEEFVAALYAFEFGLYDPPHWPSRQRQTAPTK